MQQGVSLNSLIIAFSKTIDLLDKKLHAHHWNVAYIAMKIAKEYGCASEVVHNVIQASLLHDIGIFRTDDRKKLLDYLEIETVGHEEIGALLLEESNLLTHLTPIIRNHHLAYKDWTEDITIEVGILYLADRISVLIDLERDGLVLSDELDKLLTRDRGPRFKPELVDAFYRTASNKAFWLDLKLSRQEERIRAGLIHDEIITSFQRIMSIGHLFIIAVDFRSRYTAAHSYGVSKIARLIGEYMCLSENECNILELTGFYHDIGKIAIPKEILDKPGQLTKEEKQLILGHSYFTYDILSKVEGLSEYASIAAYHHECIDGSGYPFGVKDQEIDIYSRIIMVADIFTAITESRPYRDTLSDDKVRQILEQKVVANKIDADVVNIVLEHYGELIEENYKCQDTAYRQFHEFEKKVKERTGLELN